ncbi:MAG: leucyl aminopeptidase [Moraxellaceae bacterium]|nr:MAG: leucyl aminopeptidase [Moraxellaceae bacterium]
MAYTIKSGQAAKQPSDCLIIGLYQNGDMTPSTESINKLCGGQIKKWFESGDINGALGKTQIFHGLKQVTAPRILVVGLGDEKKLTLVKYKKAFSLSMSALKNSGAKSAHHCLTEITINGVDEEEVFRQAGIMAQASQYQYQLFKSKKKKPEAKPLALSFQSNGQSASKSATAALNQGQAIGNGVNVARDLGNHPSNLCTPGYLADEAKKLAKKYTAITTQIIEEKQMAKLGMGAFLSVSKGSDLPGKLIVMKYQGPGTGKGAQQDKPIVLVGKGVTFDSGGISLKPGAAMDEMKYDMCGAASVFGTINAVAEMKLPIHMIAVVAAAENMPSGGASKPGDIVTTMSGQTVEILNTDAEGRLVLCDTLTYVERFKPRAVVDIATLTGACVVALGSHASAVYSNNETLQQSLLDAGTSSADRGWAMPLWDDYQELLNSPFADMANIGGKAAGTITAACFLSRFTKKYNWAHIDIAGTAWRSGKAKGATGRPVPMLTQYIMSRCES